MKLAKKHILFSILFLTLLLVDIYVKINMETIPYRYISKPVVILILMGYLLMFKNKNKDFKSRYLFLALFAFLIGDVLIINHTYKLNFIISMLLFVLGKLFYTAKFAHKEDFNTKRLYPFLLISFVLVAFVFNLIYYNLNDFFIPVTLYFFVSLVMALFAFIRKNAVSSSSYYIVLIGVFFFLFSELVMVLKSFYDDILYQDFLVMFFYGLAQFLIVIGLIIEKKTIKVENNPIL